MQGIIIISYSVCQRRDGLEDHSLHLALREPLWTALPEPEDLLRAGQVAAVNHIVRLLRVQYPELEAVLVLRAVSQPVHNQVQSPCLSLPTSITLLWPNFLQFSPYRVGVLAYENEVNLDCMAVRPQFLVLLHDFLVLGGEIKALEGV